MMTTRDEVLAMAEQAGFGMQIDIRDDVATKNAFGGLVETQKLERLVALAVAPYKEDAERYRWLLDRIGGDRYPSGVARFRLPDVAAHEGIFKGSVAQHFTEAIDRTRSANDT